MSGYNRTHGSCDSIVTLAVFVNKISWAAMILAAEGFADVPWTVLDLKLTQWPVFKLYLAGLCVKLVCQKFSYSHSNSLHSLQIIRYHSCLDKYFKKRVKDNAKASWTMITIVPVGFLWESFSTWEAFPWCQLDLTVVITNKYNWASWWKLTIL